MANYQNSNILYTNVTRPSFTTSGRIAKGAYTLDSSGNVIGTAGPVINAIDIDWNGAYLESLDTYINSTSDLFSQLNHIYQSIANISDNIDLSEYLKTDDLTSELLEEKLNDIFAAKSVEESIAALEENLGNKANLSDLTVSKIQGIDAFATTVWVNNQLRNYSRSAYDVYVENGGTLSRSEWLASLKGTDGVDGKSAYEIAKQFDPYIGSEYEWIQSLQGHNGYSAYELAYNADPNVGTLEEWLSSLYGHKGDTGDTGKSAYELAVQYGYVGSEEEWIESLKGQQGPQGEKGEQGTSINILGYYDTLDELKAETADTINSIGDAYNVGGDIYVFNDMFTSIEDKWKYAGQFKGEQGEEGKSAYDIYCEIEEAFGRIPMSQSDWLASLKGDKGEQGEQGKSAYDIYCEIEEALGNTPLSKEAWIASIGGESIQYSAGNGISISNNIISINQSEMWNIIQS